MLDGDSVSAEDDEKVLEIEARAAWQGLHLTPLNPRLKNHFHGTFCVLDHNRKSRKQKRGGGLKHDAGYATDEPQKQDAEGKNPVTEATYGPIPFTGNLLKR